MSNDDAPLPAGYLTLARGDDVTAEIEVRRSRFLAVLRRVDDEPAARALVTELRNAHRDARHHCGAFIIGPVPAIERSNDDGEPSGTAGTPMLEVLRGNGFSDIAAVVVRWFGGTLLGTGGLTRAYADTVAAAVQQAGDERRWRRREPRQILELDLPHADAGRIESELRDAGVHVLGTAYSTLARLRLAVSDADAAQALIAGITRGERAERIGMLWVDIPVAAPATN